MKRQVLHRRGAEGIVESRGITSALVCRRADQRCRCFELAGVLQQGISR